jgi:hypothetical protein
MDHEFVYPIVRPLAPRAIDLAPAAWRPVDTAASPAVTAVTAHGSHAVAAPAMRDRALSAASPSW